MNRENKRKTFEKGYYKTHACRDTFTCKVCGRLCTPENAGSDHRNHCPNCLSSLHVDIEPGDYLVFTGEGEMPQMVIDTWGEIWRYFAANPQVQRRFATDFEAYDGPDQVAIHIGIVA